MLPVLTTLIIFCAKYLFLTVVLLAGIFFLKQDRAAQKYMLVFGAFSLSLTLILATIAGWIFYDPRPFVSGHFIPLIAHAADNGFPSDHTLLTSAIACFIFVFQRRLGCLLLILAVVVGGARVAAGIHSPIDVAGSILISILATSIIAGIAYQRGWFHKC